MENKIFVGDALSIMPGLPAESVDLAIADSPYNIGYKYDVYSDNKSDEDFLNWTQSWGEEVKRLLKPAGSLWVVIGDKYAAEFDVLFRRQLGFHRRSWVIWYFSFGTNQTSNFTPSHVHLFYYVKNPKDFTFNPDAIRVPSARQAVYGDKRANAKGRLPDNTWVLRPADDDFPAQSSVWKFSRIAGTFGEKVKGGCTNQLNEKVVERIVLACSNAGDLVWDPFMGSGTVPAVAKRLGRLYSGCELSPAYAALIEERLQKVSVAA